MTTLAHESSGGGGRTTLARIAYWIPAAVVFALGIVAWQWVLPALGVERFLLPPFSDVMTALWDERDRRPH